MVLEGIRGYIERHYAENGFTEGQSRFFFISSLKDDTPIDVTVEVTRAPLVDGMTDMTVTLHDLPIVMNEDTTTIWAALLMTFHSSSPDYTAHTVEILQAKESGSYTDDGIADKVKGQWNKTS